MSMSEMMKGAYAKVDVVNKAFDESRSWEAGQISIGHRLSKFSVDKAWAAYDEHHQRTIDLLKHEMTKLDNQLDELDVTLARINRDLVLPEDQKKMKAVRSHIYAIFAETEALVEKAFE